jgi:transposase-like protein
VASRRTTSPSTGWVLRFTPLLADAARPCRHRVGDRWQVDQTYVKVAGQWRYVYWAIDQFGQVIDVFVSSRRDTKTAHRCFEPAIGTTKIAPAEVITDQAPVYPGCWRSCCRRPGIAATGTPTIGSRATMGG